MTPYWTSADGRHVIYHGDCRDILPHIGKVDAVVTDPPYGIGFTYDTHDDSTDQWFALMDDVVPVLRRMSDFVVMPSGQIKRLHWWYEHHKPDWVIAWYKGSPGHQSLIGFNDWEPHLTWGRPPIAMHDYFQTECGFEENGHPCPKPIAYATWLCRRAAATGETILDPFMGSGTTGVACEREGRRFIGIELEKKYCDIAIRRIEEAMQTLWRKPEPDVQLELGT